MNLGDISVPAYMESYVKSLEAQLERALKDRRKMQKANDDLLHMLENSKKYKDGVDLIAAHNKAIEAAAKLAPDPDTYYEIISLRQNTA